SCLLYLLLYLLYFIVLIFFFSSRRRHTRSKRDWSSDVCSSDLPVVWDFALVSRYLPNKISVIIMALASKYRCGCSTAPVIHKYRSEEHTSELQSRFDLVCRLLLEKKKKLRTSNSNNKYY